MRSLICPVCNEEVILLPNISWAHKSIYTHCSLDDGLILQESYEGLFEYIIKDENIRRFFVNKFNEMDRLNEEKQKPALKDNFFQKIKSYFDWQNHKQN